MHEGAGLGQGCLAYRSLQSLESTFNLKPMWKASRSSLSNETLPCETWDLSGRKLTQRRGWTLRVQWAGSPQKPKGYLSSRPTPKWTLSILGVCGYGTLCRTTNDVDGNVRGRDPLLRHLERRGACPLSLGAWEWMGRRRFYWKIIE